MLKRINNGTTTYRDVRNVLILLGIALVIGLILGIIAS